jgi:RNase adaptor protein for sRNA GlmZ degradation
LPVVIVSGLSGGGKASILRALEDIGYEAVDNPPLPMLEDMVARGDGKLAIGIDARTRGFDAPSVLLALARMRANPALLVELVYAWADQATLQRRFTETRRRHPLVPQGLVSKGIAAEQVLTADLREHADWVIDTSDLPIAALRRLIEQHFGAGADRNRMVVSLISFAYPRGLPPEADLVSMHAFCGTRTTTPCYATRRDWIRQSPSTSKVIRTSPNILPASWGWLGLSCRASCKRVKNMQRSRLGVQVVDTDPST